MQGKELSYNNINDADAAFELVSDLPAEQPAVVIIKHANPCGAAVGDDLAAAYEKALRCDPVSAYGGIVAVNRPLDEAAAEAITGIFTEVVVAPDADEAAIAVFARKPNLRLLLTGGMAECRRQAAAHEERRRRAPGAGARRRARHARRLSRRHRARAERARDGRTCSSPSASPST